MWSRKIDQEIASLESQARYITRPVLAMDALEEQTDGDLVLETPPDPRIGAASIERIGRAILKLASRSLSISALKISFKIFQSMAAALQKAPIMQESRIISDPASSFTADRKLKLPFVGQLSRNLSFLASDIVALCQLCLAGRGAGNSKLRRRAFVRLKKPEETRNFSTLLPGTAQSDAAAGLNAQKNS
jgi:hypothetical protein